MKIGKYEFAVPIFSAPMAGVTDRSFRLLAKKLGCPLCFAEMVSAKGIHYGNEKTVNMLKTLPQERPCVMQLFGSEPKILAEAAAFVEENNLADIIDFNMGCPAPKIVNNGEGSALMKKPALVKEIFAAMRKATALPLTIKIRKGFDEEHINAVEIAKIAEDAGFNAVTVHGRTREQFYGGAADWGIIANVKNAVSIPVIGNGDIRSARDMDKIFADTNCDGVMIGRAAQGNPWIFRELAAHFRGEKEVPPPSASERKEIMLCHLKLLTADKGEYIGVREMRKHAAWYTKKLPGGAKLRDMFNRAETKEEFAALIDNVLR